MQEARRSCFRILGWIFLILLQGQSWINIRIILCPGTGIRPWSFFMWKAGKWSTISLVGKSVFQQAAADFWILIFCMLPEGFHWSMRMLNFAISLMRPWLPAGAAAGLKRNMYCRLLQCRRRKWLHYIREIRFTRKSWRWSGMHLTFPKRSLDLKFIFGQCSLKSGFGSSSRQFLFLHSLPNCAKTTIKSKTWWSMFISTIRKSWSSPSWHPQCS